MDIKIIAILAVYLLILGFEYYLEALNIKNLRTSGHKIPPEFKGEIDSDFLSRSRDYLIEHTRFGIINSGFGSLLLIIFLFGGLLDIYNSWIVSLDFGFIFSGVVFFLLLSYAETILSIPFSLYGSFKIEKKFGFSTITPGIWIGDLLKSLAVSTIIMTVVITAGLWIIEENPDLWWFWLWCFFLAFSVFIMYISPYVIEPLFNKFDPIEDAELVEGIRGVMQRAGIKVSRVFKIDASRRTTHTNAYFTGIGKVKRIVLYDTLLDRLKKEELLAVLAHEAGHWKKKHLLKFMVIMETGALIALYIAYRLIEGDALNNLFHIHQGTFYSKALILGFLGSIISFPIGPVFNFISRRHEREADRYSYELTKDPEAMAGALIKLTKDNLSNLHPHPLYASFHYSHPPVIERIRLLRERAE